MSFESAMLSHPFVEIIKYYEGWYPEAYRCPAGLWTIGWGHLCAADQKPITEAEGEIFLAEDLGIAFAAIKRLAPEILVEPPQRGAALMSWVFNLGEGNLEMSTMLRRSHEHNWAAVAKEMLRWNKATNPATGKKRVLDGLTKRRRSEAHLFLTGECKIF